MFIFMVIPVMVLLFVALSQPAWRFAHLCVNNLAHKLVPTKYYDDPRNNHWIWKLNNWVGNHYIDWFIKNRSKS